MQNWVADSSRRQGSGKHELGKASHEGCEFAGFCRFHACARAKSEICVDSSCCPVMPSKWPVLPAVSVLMPDEPVADVNTGSWSL